MTTAGAQRAAEQDLRERAQRRRELEIRPLPPDVRETLSRRWRSTQERFVDLPADAVREADALVQETMDKRGYPVGDFDQQARDVSVDHGEVVSEYHAAHEISLLNDRGQRAPSSCGRPWSTTARCSRTSRRAPTPPTSAGNSGRP